MRILLVLLLSLLPLPALAGLSENALSAVELAPPPNARVPLGLTFRDPSGKPMRLGKALGTRAALLLPVDYACRMTCGPALSIISGALAETGLRPGTDFRLVLVGLNPADTGDTARAFVDSRVGDPGLAAAVTPLTGDADAIHALTDAIGYHYAEDPDNQAFAHPTGVVAVTPEGRVARALSSLALDPTNLRLALIEAGEGRVGGVTGRLALLCYGFDPVHGIYTARIQRILQIAGTLTVLFMAGAIGLISWQVRRRGDAT